MINEDTEPHTATSIAPDENDAQEVETSYTETALERESRTLDTQTSVLSEAGRAERDRLLISSAACLLLAGGLSVQKIAIAGVELDGGTGRTLSWATLIISGYFCVTFMVQASADYLRCRAGLTVAALALQSRSEHHHDRLIRNRNRIAAEHGKWIVATDEDRQKLIRISSRIGELLSLMKVRTLDDAENRELGRLSQDSDITSSRIKEIDEKLMPLRPSTSTHDLDAMHAIMQRLYRMRFSIRAGALLNVIVPVGLGIVASIYLARSLLNPTLVSEHRPSAAAAPCLALTKLCSGQASPGFP